MPFTIRPFRRFLYHAPSPTTRDHSSSYRSPTVRVLRQLTASGLQRANIVELFRPALYCLTPVLIAPRVKLSGVKLR
jgi:hypothetical protein